MNAGPQQTRPGVAGDLSALMGRGFAALEYKNIAEADRVFSKAAAFWPDNPWPLLGLAVTHMERRDMDGALQAADRALKKDCPPDVLCKLGIFYKEAGESARAVECLRAALAKDPASTMAWHNLRDLKKFTRDDPDLESLEALAAKSADLSPHARAQLQFVLGKAWLDAGDAPRAFAHYDAGNALKRAEYKYDIAVFERYVGEIIRLFDAGLVARLSGKTTVTSDRPVFIVGMPRSGSTLVDQILSSHPDAAGMGESTLFLQALPATGDGRAPVILEDFVRQLTPATLDDIARKYLALTEPFAKGAKRVADKMLFNFIWTGVILLAFPQAKVIACKRDPADMGLSIWRTWFAGNLPWTFDQIEIARYCLAQERLMRHWHSLFPGRILDVQYEKMVADQEGETKRLLDFCGLPWDVRCLDFHKTRRRVSTASDMQVRRPMYSDSVGGGKKYAEYLGPLLETLKGGT